MTDIDRTTYGYDQAAPPAYGPPMVAQPQMVSPPPMVTQPMPTSSTNVIVQQPAPTVTVLGQRGWSSGLCACCDDMSICLCVAFCPLCYEAHLATKVGENCCLPCCVPGSLIALRAHFRGKNNIAGSIMDDCCMVACCYQCTLCQLSREVDRCSNTTIVVGGGAPGVVVATNSI